MILSIISSRYSPPTNSLLSVFSSSSWCSLFRARAYAMFSFALSGSTPNRSAIWPMRSGRNVPSVSMYATLPSAPPISRGSCATTDMVCESCVLPQRNSPNTSLMLMLWKPLRVSV
ncbi:hypothetical protein BDV06DRAFT_183699, partial [Aspergillus oleicola]